MKNRSAGKKGALIIIAICVALALGVTIGAVMAVRQNAPAGAAPSGGGDAAVSLPSAPSAPAVSNVQAENLDSITPRDYTAIELPQEMRAMWISFLEWEDAQLTTEAAARASVGAMLDNCVQMGLNTVIVAVRPFGDALYESEIFPTSHLVAGTQGAEVGYDPLQVMVEEAHSRGLRIEAWINPYRIQSTVNGPDTLSADNPAVQNPEWVRDVGGNLWYDPGLPEVQQLVTAGVLEIVQNYDVDGIHFDDYFYPEFTAAQIEADEHIAFDAATFEQYAQTTADLAHWRRSNVDTLVQTVYQTIKAANPTASFGISPQGNNDNNYQVQYSDVNLWMAEGGYVDYVMPQLYWGFEYLTASGRDSYAFANVSAQWAAYTRSDSVRLYAGLGAYRIGAGDGGNNDQSEWSSGHNLADMLAHLRTVEGFSGFALFRYEFLFQNEDPLGAQEAAALGQLLQ